jgi:Family of unknown function (DUF6639)
MSIRKPLPAPAITARGSSATFHKSKRNELPALSRGGRNLRPIPPPPRFPCVCLGLLLMLALLVTPVTAWTQELNCPASRVKVCGGSARDREWVCAATREAGAFFRLNGLELAAGTTVLLTGRLAGNDGSHALGEYHVADNRILLLTHEEAFRLSARAPFPLGIPMSPELWRSYVVHELAHAAAERAFAPGVEKFAASEYIAAVAQIASLPEAVRNRIFEHFPNLPGFGARTEITALYYFFAPGKFAVKAYRHYSRPENGPSFIKSLLREGLVHSG